MRISDWSSDVCSSDLWRRIPPPPANAPILPTDQHASTGLSRGCSTQAKNGRACGGSEIDVIGLRHLALPRQTHDDEVGPHALPEQDDSRNSHDLAPIGRDRGPFRPAIPISPRTP